MRRFFVCCALLALSACCLKKVDEKYATQLVKNHIKTVGEITTQKIKSGLGGATLFLVADAKQKYIVRVMPELSRQERENEIYNWQLASDGGYGPKIFFTDPKQGVLVMAFLSGQKIDSSTLWSSQFYLSMTRLLREIHTGKNFMGRFDPFKRIAHSIDREKKKFGTSAIPFDKLAHLTSIIHQTLKPHLISTPCHNDLNMGNVTFFGDSSKAIDWSDAAPNDPYFDLATVVVGYQLCGDRRHEQKFLAAHVGHTPSEKEQAKLYLMEQIILIKWALDHISQFSHDDVRHYESTNIGPVNDFFKHLVHQIYDLDRQNDLVAETKGFLAAVFETAESSAFQDALKTLRARPRVLHATTH